MVGEWLIAGLRYYLDTEAPQQRSINKTKTSIASSIVQSGLHRGGPLCLVTMFYSEQRRGRPARERSI